MNEIIEKMVGNLDKIEVKLKEIEDEINNIIESSKELLNECIDA